jgi:hypothetical protein
VSVCANVLLQLRWIPPCLFLAAAVCNRVPRVPVFIYIYVYSEDQKKRKNRTTNCTNERNILNITKRLLVYSICDYEEQTSLCDLSSFLLRMYLMGCPSSFLSCSTRVMRRRKKTEKKKAKYCAMRCIYPI